MKISPCIAVVIVAFLISPVSAQLRSDGATASFRGALPPKPVAEPSDAQLKRIESKWREVNDKFRSIAGHPNSADAEIFIKAVRYAIDFREWYDKKSDDAVKKAESLLNEASQRIESLNRNETPWLEGSGLKVLGFRSRLDDSAQPYGVEVPEGLAFGRDKPAVPMWIWLHGRGDTSTDLNFVYSRLSAKKPGQFQPAGTIVIHPFGRYCNGYKSAGAIDVLESRDDAIRRFHIDPNRIALAGFSMGGAGAWHLGAHYADQWAVVHAGAGFVDVKRYQKLTPDKYPAWYEQTLWNVYDVPQYARNLLNVPVIAYSGENDKQRDAAEYMIEVLAKENYQPPHFIGPGVEHKYHPETIKDVQAAIEKAVEAGRNERPETVSIQTRTLAYSRMHWLQIYGMEQHWEEARADADWDTATNTIQIKTKNVTSLAIHLDKLPRIEVDGQVATLKKSSNGHAWIWHRDPNIDRSLRKVPGLQGPIDDAFRSRFIVVLPDTNDPNNKVDQWVELESKHFLERWRSLMRGEPITKRAREVTKDDIESSHLILWGTPTTNAALKKLITTGGLADAFRWDNDGIVIGSAKADPTSHVPTLIYPNPLNPTKYIVVNSGLTFREAHDRTNSLQNPKLPDWAILEISQPPSAEAAGKVVAADFYNENWQPKK